MLVSSGLFVAGTDTGVGKTIVSSCLVKALEADYWKPVQSGVSSVEDTKTVARLANMSADRIHPCTYNLQASLSPHMAAKHEGVYITLDKFQLPQSKKLLIVEGAGGLLAPLNEKYFMIDVIARLGLPVLLVTSNKLGAVNHTLLSLKELYNRRLVVLGVVVTMNETKNGMNYAPLESYIQIVVKRLPYIDKLDPSAIGELSRHFLAFTEQLA